ncbi:MAG TPA: type II secretion system F family protein [Polyangiales bacterium]|nr:type II secretion system F family protein [Polyangiales bacterium]
MIALVLRLSCLLCVLAAAWLVARALLAGLETAGPLGRYVAELDTRLLALQRPARGRWIAAGQAGLLVVLALVARWLDGRVVLLAAALAAFAPIALLARLQHKRRTDIERQLNGLTTALANALRASRSLGQGLERAREAATGPLAEELGLVLKELRLGATVEQAMLNLSARVGSRSLESVVCALLIGRQIGGRVPEILETTGATLREMERIAGVIRSKTSEGKGQLAVMALAPPFIFVVFDRMQPGYFEPLTQSLAGLVLSAGVLSAWAASIALARRILALEV